MRRVVAVLATVALGAAGFQYVATRPGSVEVASLASARIGPGTDLLDPSGVVLPSREPAASGFAAAATVAAPAPTARPLPPPRRPPASQEKAIAPPPEKFSGPKAAPAPPPPQLNQAPQTQARGATWAVMIGVNNYPGSGHDLKSAVNDANDLNEALWRFGVPSENRLLMRDGQVTANTIRASIDWLNRNAGPDSVAVFFFAGHVRKVGNGRESMVAADGSLVSDQELASRLGNLRAGRSWIAIAGCYGGGFTEVLGPGRILTGAAPANSLAYENSGFGRSYMVQYMVREAMIEGRASGTSVEAAFAYARDAIARDYPNRQPVQYDQAQGLLELRPAGAPPPNHAPPPPQRGQQAPPPSSGGGGGSAPKDPPDGSNPDGSPPPQQSDGCNYLSMGAVRCEQGDPHDD